MGVDGWVGRLWEGREGERGKGKVGDGDGGEGEVHYSDSLVTAHIPPGPLAPAYSDSLRPGLDLVHCLLCLRLSSWRGLLGCGALLPLLACWCCVASYGPTYASSRSALCVFLCTLASSRVLCPHARPFRRRNTAGWLFARDARRGIFGMVSAGEIRLQGL